METNKSIWEKLIKFCEVDAEVDITTEGTIFTFKYSVEKIWFGQVIRSNLTNFSGAIPVQDGFKFIDIDEPPDMNKIKVDWGSKPVINKIATVVKKVKPKKILPRKKIMPMPIAEDRVIEINKVLTQLERAIPGRITPKILEASKTSDSQDDTLKNFVAGMDLEEKKKFFLTHCERKNITPKERIGLGYILEFVRREDMVEFQAEFLIPCNFFNKVLDTYKFYKLQVKIP